MFTISRNGPGRAREQHHMCNIFLRMELEFKPLGPGLAKVRFWIGAQTGLNCTGKTQVKQFVGVQMREFATRHRPCRMAARAEA